MHQRPNNLMTNRTMAPNANQVFRKWKSIRHIVNTVNKGIRQHSCQIQIQIPVLSSPKNLSTNKTKNTSLKYESYIKRMKQEVEYEYVEMYTLHVARAAGKQWRSRNSLCHSHHLCRQGSCVAFVDYNPLKL